MKYCYRCGTEYADSNCPNCSSDLYTEKPNSRTKSDKDGKEVIDLIKEINKI